METNEKEKIINEIFKNTLEFMAGEFNLNFKTKSIPFSEILSISNIIFCKMFIHSVVNISEIIEESPFIFFKSLEIENKIKEAMEEKNG